MKIHLNLSFFSVFDLEFDFQKIFLIEKKSTTNRKTPRRIVEFLDSTKENTKWCDVYSTGKKIGFVYNDSLIVVQKNGDFVTLPLEFEFFDYLESLKKYAKISGPKTQEIFIKALTPVVYASCYYNRGSDRTVFKAFDVKLFDFLWKWACRRHNNKSKNWIKRRYFSKFRDKTWFFGHYFKIDSKPKFQEKNFVFFTYLPFHLQIFERFKIRKRADGGL